MARLYTETHYSHQTMYDNVKEITSRPTFTFVFIIGIALNVIISFGFHLFTEAIEQDFLTHLALAREFSAHNRKLTLDSQLN